VTTHYAGTEEARREILHRFDTNLEIIYGYVTEISRGLNRSLDMAGLNILPVDEIFAAWSPDGHLSEDFFRNKLAFVALLNFPVTTLEERLRYGPEWTAEQWAAARLAQFFGERIPADITRSIADAASRAAGTRPDTPFIHTIW